MTKKASKTKNPLVRTLVDNPYFLRGHETDATNPDRIHVTLNTKESAVETLFARGQLGISQKRAADRFRALWEAAGGKVSSIDYSADRVDGGRGEPIITKLEAAKQMQRCRDLLGLRGFENVQAVCGEGKALSELSPHKRARLTMADNLRADLDDLAVMWGLQRRRVQAA